MDEKVIGVYENWSEEQPVLAGIMRIQKVRGSETFSFEYDENWLRSSAAIQLDPNLELYPGPQYPESPGRFGMIADSSPDRWGRTLLKRREQQEAMMENRKPTKLLESDFLLGLNDRTRIGGLRFSADGGQTFLASEDKDPVPPMARLRDLEEAARGFELNSESGKEKYLMMLIEPGSSLGGARPKANVEDEKGDLWIAKFPGKFDERDVGAWEMVVHDLAKLCGLEVCEAMIHKFSSRGSTYLSKRFDRNGGRRIHFVSAMTLLGKKDGDGGSYLDLADFIRAEGSQPKEDLWELWKRAAFNMLISNTDDHLRNHGFLLKNRKWKLSPVYDLNPNPTGNQLSLEVVPEDSSIRQETIMEMAEYLDLDLSEAREVLEFMFAIVQKEWIRLAKFYRISSSEIETMRPAFEKFEYQKEGEYA